MLSPSGKGDKESQHDKKRIKPLNFATKSGLEDVPIDQNADETTAKENSSPKQAAEDHAMPDPPQLHNAWTEGSRHLFGRPEGWYVADSDSEDIAEIIREEDECHDDEEEDPLCPLIEFTAAEKAAFRREWRSALIVKGLGRKVSYLPLARRLNYLWEKHGALQITDMQNGCFFVRFREKEDYETAMTGGLWLLGDTG
ncbi:hypothetical protein LINGRAHAP2_LOCUS22333 [Linum grandiflorum]